MKPITITNWGLLYISLGFVAFVYAVPDNIMSYGLAQNLVELTANTVPAMEKLRQAYEQQFVTGVAVFFHAAKWLLVLIALPILPWLSCCRTKRLSEASIKSVAFSLMVFAAGYWIVSIQAMGLEGVGDRWFIARYEFKASMAIVGGLFDLLMLVLIKELLYSVITKFTERVK